MSSLAEVKGIPQRLRVKTLGVEVSLISIEGLKTWLSASERGKRPRLLLGHNLHSVYLFHADENFRRLYAEPGVVLADGFPVMLAARLASRSDRSSSFKVPRVGSTDWIPLLSELPAGARVAIVGASPLSNEKFCARVSAMNPQIQVVGFSGEDWGDRKQARVFGALAAEDWDFVLVGLGMPLQERVATELLGLVRARVIACVGGAVDQISGVQKNAPRWLGKFGLEWLWRLASQPSRLWRRYLLEPFQLGLILAKRRWSRSEGR